MDRTSARAAALLLAALEVWAILIVAAPFLRADSDSAPLRTLALVSYAIGSGICHQHPHRSFAAAGIPWPVCARCSGIYLGAAFASLVLLLAPRVTLWPTASRRWRLVLLLGLVIVAASWTIERTGWIATSNPTRFGLGLPLGLATGALLAAARRQATRQPEVN